MSEVFVCFDSEDKLFMKKLILLLQESDPNQFEFWDEGKIPLGQGIKSQINDHIESCDIFLYILSPESVKSVKCIEQYTYAKTLDKPILPVLVRGQVVFPSRLSGLAEKKILDFKNGVDDRTAFNELRNALISFVPKTRRRASTSKPDQMVDTQVIKSRSDGQRIAIIAGVFTLLAALITGIFAVIPALIQNQTKLTPTNLDSNLTNTEIVPTMVTLKPTVVTSNNVWTPTENQDFNGIKMVWVPQGCFTSPTIGSEKCLEGFWIDLTEVNQKDFTRLGGTVISTYTGDNKPVQNINLNEAEEFCKKRGGNLPTDLEWEYAASGPSNWIYPWGNDFNNMLAAYRANANSPEDVGKYKEGKSWVGALDMSGNVAEWVIGSDSSVFIKRGGSWHDSEDKLKATYRTVSSNSDPYTGFRCITSNNP